MAIAVRPAGRADLEAFAAIANEATPEVPTSVDEMLWFDRTYPGGARFVGELDGAVVGAASVGRILMFQPDFDAYWMTIDVLAACRRRGVGSALYGAVSEVAAGAGKVALHAMTSAEHVDAIAFLTGRGFAEYSRGKVVVLDLEGRPAPDVDPPPGVEVVSLADRPELVGGVHAVAAATFADIPTGGEPVDAGPLDEFVTRDVAYERIPKEAFAVAVASTSGDVIGYASLVMLPGSTTRAYHDMTAVVRAWRGRGVAAALKRATIRWAIGAGLERLETGNDPANGPMRALNARLGYRPLPDEITFRGPLAHGATPS